MKFIDKKISNSYYQIYIILDSKEKKEIITFIKQQILSLKKDELKEEIKLFKSINESSNSEQSLEKLNSLKEELKLLKIENINFKTSELESYLSDYIQKDVMTHVESLNIIQVFAQDNNFIGNFNDNNPLTIVYSFCYVPKDYNIKYPKTKGNAYLFTSRDVDMIQTEMLIANKFYSKHKVLYSTEFSDLQFSYMCEDDMKFNLYMDISEIEGKFQIDRSELIGLERNKYLVKNRDNQNCIINIKEIYDKNVLDMTDEIAKKINYLNTKTTSELRKKIEEVYSFIYNINSNVTSILQNISRINDFNIDDYVLTHFKKISELEEIDDQTYEDLKLNFVTSYIFGICDVNIEKYFFYLEEEYKLLYRVKKPEDELTFEEYFNFKAPYYALYEFFRQKNLVTERSYNE